VLAGGVVEGLDVVEDLADELGSGRLGAPADGFLLEVAKKLSATAGVPLARD
jgi:hypothetical protein